MDRGFRTGVAQFHAYRVDGRMSALRQQGISSFLDFGLVQAATRHFQSPLYFVTYYMPRNYILYR